MHDIEQALLMNDTFMVIFFAAAGFAFWLFVAIAVGKAAAKKSRRRWLWTLLSIFPLGPIVGPLFLASMPPVGENPPLVRLSVGLS